MSAREALQDADQAARQARRLVDASRGIITGNIAMAFCLPPMLMVLWEAAPHADGSRILGALLSLAFLAWVVMSIRMFPRLRSAGAVSVVDRVEVNLNEIQKHPFRRLVPAYAWVLGWFLLWGYLFKVMPYSAVVITMWTVTAVLTGVFIGRFVYFQFWEDLVFAASVTLAWGLYLLRLPRLALVAALPPIAVILATICLYQRWRTWVRSVPAAEAGLAAPGVQV
ncbi:MAG TPA: hypothetical protein VGZ22_00855 [Isosphaeraceae bacterium]|nr:hypothetical protein [Isosphaeraceae bacterium]